MARCFILLSQPVVAEPLEQDLALYAEQLAGQRHAGKAGEQEARWPVYTGRPGRLEVYGRTWKRLHLLVPAARRLHADGHQASNAQVLTDVGRRPVATPAPLRLLNQTDGSWGIRYPSYKVEPELPVVEGYPPILCNFFSLRQRICSYKAGNSFSLVQTRAGAGRSFTQKLCLDRKRL